MRDMKNNVVGMPTISPQTSLVAITGTGVNRAGYESVTALINVGPLTHGEFTFNLMESDEDANYTAVAAADLIGSAPVVNDLGDDNSVLRVGYKGQKKWVRLDMAVTAQSPSLTTGLPVAAQILLGHPLTAPTA